MASLFRPTKPVPIPPNTEIVSKNGRRHARILDGGRAVLYALTADGAKYLKPTTKWYGKYTDGNGIVQRVPLTADKSAARLMLSEIVKRAERQRFGLHDPAEYHARRPLAAHLDEYSANCSTSHGRVVGHSAG
jgi:hypothetical protein